MAIFVPATGETDQKKQNMSLQLIGGLVSGYEATWTAWTPTVTAGAGTLTTVSGAGRYKVNGKTVSFSLTITLTTNGTGSSDILFTLPVNNVGSAFSVCGREMALTGKSIAGFPISATQVGFTYYDGTYPGANATVFYVSGVYEAA